MSDLKPSNTREALIAEMLGDIHVSIEKFEQVLSALKEVDNTLGANTKALTDAIQKYQEQINEMAARLRVETAAMLTKTTEHAAAVLVGQQTSVLQQAATLAIRKAIKENLSAMLIKYMAITSIITTCVISAVIAIVIN